MHVRIQSLARMSGMTMFDRIDMNITDMPRAIVIAPNRMLSIAPPPNAALALFLPAGGAPFRRRQMARECSFDLDAISKLG